MDPITAAPTAPLSTTPAEPAVIPGTSPPSVVTAGYAGYEPARAVAPDAVLPVVTPKEQIEQPLPPPLTSTADQLELLFAQLLPADAPSPGNQLTIDDVIANRLTPKLPVEQLLAAACPWLISGGSLMGWSKLSTAKYCLRQFYYKYVLGLTPKKDPEYLEDDPEYIRDHTPDLTDAPTPIKSKRKLYLNPLSLGTLVHACIEAWYRTGDPDAMWSPAEAVKVHHPALALEARRLVGMYLRRYAEIEAETWDTRAVERESRFYFPARKCRGKKRSLCVTARHDGLYRAILPGEARLPPGVAAPSGMQIAEVKTTATLTYNRQQGFRQNAQLMMGLLTYNFGNAVKFQRTATGLQPVVLAQSTAEIFGPAWDVTVTWIGKAARGDLSKDIDRMEYAFSAEAVRAFQADIEDWYYEEICDRLFSNQWQDAATWRKDWTCADRHMPGWICPHLSICSASDCNAHYMYDVENPLDRTALERPNALAKLEKRRVKTVATVEAK